MQENSPLLPHGGYEKLKAYKLAEVIYDATVVCCNRFIDKRSRTHDQMVQAARSGVRNISEGSGAAATSKKSEIFLTNVARASLSDELLKDYASYLTQNRLTVWPKESREALAMRERLKQDQVQNLPPTKPGNPQLTGLHGLIEFIRKAEPEPAANAMLCVINQCSFLLRRLMEQQSQEFTEKGGFTERLYAARASARAEGPPCPTCGNPTKRRTAAKGQNAGNEFWGCSDYPDCRGTLSIKSDKSEKSD